MVINDSIFVELVYEQYRHDKLSLIIEDSIDNGLFCINDIVLNDSNCIFILLKLLSVENLNDIHQSAIFDKYQNTILYLDSNDFLNEDDFLNFIKEYIIWLKEYIKKEQL